MTIEWIGNGAILQTEKVSFTYEQKDDSVRDRYFTRKNESAVEWDNETFNFVGDFRIHPYGRNNDLPAVIKDIVQTNYIAPGILKKKTQLLWGMGPKLYSEKIENRKLIRDWQDDKEVSDWLKSWDYEKYLISCAVDFQHLEGCFSRFELNKGSRIGKNFINKLAHIPPDKARLASLIDSNNPEPSHIVLTEWDFNHLNSLTEYKVYNIFDFANPFKSKNSILYSNMYSFCTDYYTVPDLYGSLEWLRRSTATPLILKAFSKNAINLKYHIISPAAFWDKKREEIQENCHIKGIPFKESMLTEYKELLLNQISDVLAGEENTGKYLHTTKSLTVEGTQLLEHGWEVKVIDQNIKDFVEAQIKISQRADYAVAAGVGLHAALGNVSETGKSDSGSEQLYALKNYLLTGIDIPEMIVTKALNYAIRANFPDKDLKIGFYHMLPEKEQDITPSDRIKNNV